MLPEEVESGRHKVIPADHDIGMKAFQLLQHYYDKPDISFVDFTSFVIMQEEKITNVFSGDRHFEQVNLGFHLLK
ncbi:MAG: hypothetical protein HY960_00660 [Ignavibacteriae bacterium]|nr:hypothetical protein [Ignavibacteriota bacterium]